MTPYFDDGQIQIYHGDARDVLPRLEPVDLILADPPYGIDYQSAWRIDPTQWKPKIANDERPYIWFLLDAFNATKTPGSLVCFCRWDVQEIFRSAIDTAGYEVKSQLIWDREAHGMGDLNGAAAPQHDVIWFGTKGKFSRAGSRLKSVIRSQRLSGEQLLHPNQKPCDLIKQILTATCDERAVVCDPFVGSGTTLRAAKDLGMRAIGIDTSEQYCEMSARRMAQQAMDFGNEVTNDVELTA